jgi:hypothetical protein
MMLPQLFIRHFRGDNPGSSICSTAEGSTTDSSATTTADSMLDATLAITNPVLEQRFWSRRCTSRLNSLDALYELCNTLIWLSILPMLQGSDQWFGKASLAIAAAQLAAVQLTTRFWLSSRTSLLSAGMLLRCTLLVLQTHMAHSSLHAAAANGALDAQHSDPWQQQQQQQAASPFMDSSLASSMTVAAGLWGNLLFVLFHQQPVRFQVPLLAISCVMQAYSACQLSIVSDSFDGGFASAAANSTQSSWGSDAGLAGSSSSSSSSRLSLVASLAGRQSKQHAAAGLLSFSQVLNWGLGLLAAGGVQPGTGFWQFAAPQPEASVLATKLFVHAFGGFLLPVFVAYLMEWRYKVVFLLSACTLSQHQQLQVLTPAAAVMRANMLLGSLLYVGWLLLLATSSWVVCCAVASILSL